MALAATLPSKVDDDELAGWLAGGGSGRRELIVDAAVPPRRAAFEIGARGRPRSTAIATSDGPSRAAVLRELAAYLRSRLAVEPVELAAAGAFAIEATREEARRLLGSPLVRAIRPNRKLSPPSPMRRVH